MTVAVESFLTRFAPSPTGLLHRGHAFSALTVWGAAAEAHGQVLLRIEDIDRTRCRPEYGAGILEDLAWLGLRWPEPVRRQSEHMADYEAALDRLRGQGLLYRDFRTRRQIAEAAASAPHGPEPVVRGAADQDEAERLARGDAFAWRLDARAALRAAGPVGWRDDAEKAAVAVTVDQVGDVVLARKDVGVAYHLAVAVDDALQGVTHVIRGEDLRDAAPIHALLQVVLDLPRPVYRHHRLLTDAHGRRYAKRDRAETLQELRARGVTAEALRAELGFA